MSASPSLLTGETDQGPAVRFSRSQLEAFHKLCNELKCTLCAKLLVDPHTTSCQHTFCHTCIHEHVKVTHACPKCLRPVVSTELKANMLLANCVQSTIKIQAYLQECGATYDSVEAENSAMESEHSAKEPSTERRGHRTHVEATERADEEEEPVDEAEIITYQQIPGPTLMIDTPDSDVNQSITNSPMPVIPEPAATMATIAPPNTQQIEEARLITANLQQRFDDITAKLVLDTTTGSMIPTQVSSSTTQDPKNSVKAFAVSSLSGPKRYKHLKRLIERLGNATLVEDFVARRDQNLAPTHIIVGASEIEPSVWKCKPTYKYFWALSAGCWILHEQFLDDCEREGTWVPEKSYNVYSYSSTIVLSRLPSAPKLFAGQTILLGPFSKSSLIFTKDQCKELLELNGATVIDVGGENDGSDIDITIATQTLLARMDEKFVLVGHPSELTHENGECSFCKSVYSTIRDSVKGSQVRTIESAWIMLCLESLLRKDISEYELISS